MTALTGFHVGPGHGPAWWFLDTRMTIKADTAQTAGLYTMIEFEAPRGFSPPRHVHRVEDEAFLVLDGALRVLCGEDEWEAEPGSFVFLPRGVAHSFVVASSSPVRAWQLTSPAGFESFVAALGLPATAPGLPAPGAPPDFAHFAAVAAEHGYDLVGPPLELDEDARP